MEIITDTRLCSAIGARMSRTLVTLSDLVVMVKGWLHSASTSMQARATLHFASIGWNGSVLVPKAMRSEEHTSELQSLMRISYAVFCLKKKKQQTQYTDKVTERT